MKFFEFAKCSVAFLIVMFIGYFNFFIRTDVLWISRKTFGILWFILGLVGLLFYIVTLRIEGKYLLIDDKKLIWKPGIFQKKNEILLDIIERAEIGESVITLFIEDRTQVKIDKTKIISTKKKKELDRVVTVLFGEE